MFVGIEVLITEIESFQLFKLLRYILNPAYNGDGILLIARVHKTCACVLHWIVGQETTGNHRIHSLIVTNLYLTLAFLILADSDFQFIVTVGHDDGGLTCLLVYVALLVVPELAIVDGAIFEEGYFPITLVVAPIGRKELLPTFLHRFDALNLESTLAVALDEVEYLSVLRQRREMERHIPLVVLVCLYKLVEFYAIGRSDGITLLPYFQITIASKLKAKVRIVRTLQGGDIHHGFVVLQFHLRHIKGEIEESVAVTVSILNGGLLPHHIFRLPHHNDEGQQDGC